MTYRPGDTFTKKLPLTEEGVSVTATVERNGSTESGIGITSVVNGQICAVTMAIPSGWAAGDHVSIMLTATLDDETSYKVVEFMLESQRLSAVASQTSVDAVKEDTSYVHGKFTQLPPGRPALIIPAASSPEMVVLAVVLRDGATLANGELVTVTMRESGPVYLDGAHEIKKSYSGTTGEYDDGENVHQGVALIEVFPSWKLAEKKYNSLYNVSARGVRRDVWVPATGGELGLLPTEAP